MIKKAIAGAGCLLLFLSFAGRAQNVDFGITTGFQVTSHFNDEIPNFSGRLGMFFGGHASVFINDRVVVKPILMFSRKGSWIDADARPLDDNTIYIITNDYLSLPILAKLYVTKGFHAQAGPRVSYLLAAVTKTGGGGKTDDGNLKEKGIIRPIDAGIVFGLGYEFESTFTFAINFDVSLVNQIKDQEGLESVITNEFEEINFIEPFPASSNNLAIQFVFSYNFTKNRSAF